jgi:hypothetical protein
MEIILFLKRYYKNNLSQLTKNLSIFNPKNFYYWVWDPGSGKIIPDPGSRGQNSPVSRISNTGCQQVSDGSGFDQVRESGIRIRIREGKNCPQNRKNLRNFKF